MSEQICANCGVTFKTKKLFNEQIMMDGKVHQFCSKICAVTFLMESEENDSDSLHQENNLVRSPGFSAGQSHAGGVAVKSARIVNAYGTYIQIFGIVIGVLSVIGGFSIARQTGSSTWYWVGIIVGLIEIAVFAVQGALFRMIANYVIARLEN